MYVLPFQYVLLPDALPHFLVLKMVDCHMHTVLDGLYWKAAIDRHREHPLEDYIQTVLNTYRELGYTYLRDGGDRWGVGKRARQLAAPMGITYRTPLSPLCKAGCYGAFIGETFQNEKEFAALAEKQKKNGGDFIKIMISGLMDFDNPGKLMQAGPSAEEIAYMISISKDLGMSVMAHCNGVYAALAAAKAGVDSIEHGAYLNNEALCAMKEANVVWVPTLSTIGNLLGKGRYPDKGVEEILESALKNVKAYKEFGGLVACGSDAGAWAVPHGCETEISWLHKAGLTDAEIQKGNQAIIEKF